MTGLWCLLKLTHLEIVLDERGQNVDKKKRSLYIGFTVLTYQLMDSLDKKGVGLLTYLLTYSMVQRPS